MNGEVHAAYARGIIFKVLDQRQPTKFLNETLEPTRSSYTALPRQQIVDPILRPGVHGIGSFQNDDTQAQLSIEQKDAMDMLEFLARKHCISMQLQIGDRYSISQQSRGFARARCLQR